MDFDKLFEALSVFGDKSFPDAAFMVEKGAEKDKEGKTLQKFRHLPHHKKTVKSPTENGSVDLPHLRNALARANQVKPVKENATTFRKRSMSHLQTHAKALLKSYKSKGSLTVDEQEFIIFCATLKN
jgi:hypothetical protein